MVVTFHINQELFVTEYRLRCVQVRACVLRVGACAAVCRRVHVRTCVGAAVCAGSCTCAGACRAVRQVCAGACAAVQLCLQVRACVQVRVQLVQLCVGACLRACAAVCAGAWQLCVYNCVLVCLCAGACMCRCVCCCVCMCRCAAVCACACLCCCADAGVCACFGSICSHRRVCVCAVCRDTCMRARSILSWREALHNTHSRRCTTQHAGSLSTHTAPIHPFTLSTHAGDRGRSWHACRLAYLERGTLLIPACLARCFSLTTASRPKPCLLHPILTPDTALCERICSTRV
jgi:hypothetical protein